MLAMSIATVYPCILSTADVAADAALLVLQIFKDLVTNHWVKRQTKKVLNYKKKGENVYRHHQFLLSRNHLSSQ